MLNPFKLLKIYSGLNQLAAVIKERGPMTVARIMQTASILVGILGAVNAATVANGFVHQHVLLCAGLYAFAQVLHAVMPSIFPAPNPGGVPITKAVILALALSGLMLGSATVHAQAVVNAPAAAVGSNGVAASSGPVAVYFAHGWGVGVHSQESYDLLDFGAARNTRVYVIGDEQSLTTAGFNLFSGGLGLQPDLSKLFAKSNLPANSLSLLFSVTGGNALPSSGANSHFSLTSGVKLQYRMASSVAWNPLEFSYLRIGAANGYSMSTQLAYFF